MSQDIEDTSNLHGFGAFSFRGRVPSGGLVIPGRVKVELAEQLAGGSVEDADVQVLD